VSIDFPENKSGTLNSNQPEIVQESGVLPGTLYLVATPIGNLADITERAITVLSEVDIIAAEDTRHSQKLLSSYGIKTKLISCHEHNEERITPRMLAELESGSSIALISDAGTPLISDPGYRLLACAYDKNLKVVPIPGVCAAIAALSVAGLATDRFAFEGFPPAKHGTRVHFFERLAEEARTMIFYVSCHRIVETLKDMKTIFGGQRRITFAREITKTYETIRRMQLSDLITWVETDNNQRKGEIVLVLEGKVLQDKNSTEFDSCLTVLLAELPLKQSVSLAAKITGANKNDIYRRALELKDF
jgi:16S rRNA (cytidine1402-2'-O)-methyltransferase